MLDVHTKNSALNRSLFHCLYYDLALPTNYVIIYYQNVDVFYGWHIYFCSHSVAFAILPHLVHHITHAIQFIWIARCYCCYFLTNVLFSGQIIPKHFKRVMCKNCTHICFCLSFFKYLGQINGTLLHSSTMNIQRYAHLQMLDDQCKWGHFKGLTWNEMVMVLHFISTEINVHWKM